MKESYPEGICGECVYAINKRYDTNFIDYGNGTGDQMIEGLIDCELRNRSYSEMDYSCKKFEMRVY